MKIDLHTHSIASDGQFSSSKLVEMAKENKLELYAITDHDSISGLCEAEKEARRIGVRFIPGIEISCQDSEEIHIVGLDIDYSNTMLVNKCMEFQRERLNRGEKICKYLSETGISIDYDEVRGFAGGGLVARPHFAKYMLEHGIVKTRKEAFDRYLDTDEFKRKTERMKPSCKEAIDLIHDAGGLAVLAHPGLYKMPVSEKKLLVSRLAENGIDGIECFYSKHDEEESDMYYKWMLEYDLKFSIGSDFHGPDVKPSIRLGMEIEMDKYIDDFILGEHLC